ncbi:MAG: alpha/beta hydrolase, partial [Solirubrobacteraceae bacterium]|nr:alpha/beta hydrolase [Patulibacter sp.]
MSPTPPVDRLAPRLQYGPVGRSAWQDIPWQDLERQTELLGRTVNYVDVGSGPVVICVHGLSGNWMNWLENIPQLAREHRVIAIDLPGFGRSPMPQSEITIGLYADVLIALLHKLGLQTATLIGNSMGGQISAKLAIEHPELIDRLVLVSPAGVTIDIARNPQVLWVLKTFGWLYSAGARTASLGSDPLSKSAPLRRALLGVVCRYPERLPGPLVQRQIFGAGTPGFAPAVHAIGNCDLSDELERIELPAQLIWGRNDRIVPSGDLRLWTRDIAGSESVIYEDTGHVPMFERPARFNADVNAFLARTRDAVRSTSDGVIQLDELAKVDADGNVWADRRLAPRALPPQELPELDSPISVVEEPPAAKAKPAKADAKPKAAAKKPAAPKADAAKNAAAKPKPATPPAKRPQARR